MLHRLIGDANPLTSHKHQRTSSTHFMEGPVLLYVWLVHFRQWTQNGFSCHSRHTCSIIKVLIYSGLVKNVKMTATKTKIKLILREKSVSWKGFCGNMKGPHKGQVFTFRQVLSLSFRNGGWKRGSCVPVVLYGMYREAAILSLFQDSTPAYVWHLI